MSAKNRDFRVLLSLTAIITMLFIFSCEKRGPEGARPNAITAFMFQGNPTAEITFLSTQMNPVEEAGKFRNIILKDFPEKVDFRPNDNDFIFDQIDSLLRNAPKDPILIGALHGDLVKLYEKDALRKLNDIYGGLSGRAFPEYLLKLCKLNGEDIYYVPWMQASFVMVANKKALAYLPEGANLAELTYDQLYQWTDTIFAATGMRLLGFPAGDKGLLHRFFQGYLYPSFTANTLVKFRSPEAVKMWRYFADLWRLVDPSSLVYSTMAEPLLTGDVWIVWDHTARLIKAFEERPNDFVAFPAPTGPKGRGFMAVISGLSVPKDVEDVNGVAMLIDYLTRPEIQNRTLTETGFFPVVDVGVAPDIPEYLQGLRAAVAYQANAENSIPTLIPIGLGERGNDYNNYFMLTFSQIVLAGEDMTTTLNANAQKLQEIINEENAKCWPPDNAKGRPFEIE